MPWKPINKLSQNEKEKQAFEKVKMIKKKNNKKLMKKYEKLIKFCFKTKDEFDFLSIDNKGLFKNKLSKLKLLITIEKDKVKKELKSEKNKNVKISFLNKLENKIEIEELEKRINNIKKINNLKYSELFSSASCGISSAILSGFDCGISSAITGCVAACIPTVSPITKKFTKIYDDLDENVKEAINYAIDIECNNKSTLYHNIIPKMKNKNLLNDEHNNKTSEIIEKISTL